MYYHQQVLTIAGTHSINDVLTDLTIPFGNALESTGRFRKAEWAFLTHQPKLVIGHSLGAAIAAHLAKLYPDQQVEFRLYGAPRLSWNEQDPRIHSFRHYLDPVSIFDRAASSTFRFGNPHSTRGY